MGSFNEVCALSYLNIGPGTPVRLVFLTKNPYVECDEREAHRGCYHYDHWFVRTPPLKGVYDDYGRCTLKDSPVINLIAECFDRDAVERSFGFNNYHAYPVKRGAGFQQYLEAAGQGRLLVEEEDYLEHKESEPEDFPSWQKVQAILEKSNLPIQKRSENGEGYNAQRIMRGVVCVTFSSYGDNAKRLENVSEILSKTYDCKMTWKHAKQEPCLIVAPRGALENSSMLYDQAKIERILRTHPERIRERNRKFPVLAVMIREDVWKAYCTVNTKKKSRYDDYFNLKKISATTKFIEDAFEKANKDYSASKEIYETAGLKFSMRSLSLERPLRSLFVDIPFQTTAITHLIAAMENEGFTGKKELFRSCAELARVEHVMACLHHPWQIPTLGGQEGCWELRTNLLASIANVSKNALEQEVKQMEEWEKEDEEFEAEEKRKK